MESTAGVDKQGTVGADAVAAVSLRADLAAHFGRNVDRPGVEPDQLGSAYGTRAPRLPPAAVIIGGSPRVRAALVGLSHLQNA